MLRKVEQNRMVQTTNYTKVWGFLTKNRVLKKTYLTEGWRYFGRHFCWWNSCLMLKYQFPDYHLSVFNQSINQINLCPSAKYIKNVQRRSSSKLLLIRIFEKVTLQEFLELFKSTIFDVSRQSVPQSRCIGRKGSVTKGNTPSPWLDKSSTIRARWSELPTSSYLKYICDIRWSLSMKSFVHKSKYFVINALFDGKPVKFINEFCSDGIKLAFFEN